MLGVSSQQTAREPGDGPTRSGTSSRWALIVRRTLDVVLAFVALAVAGAAMLVVALLVRLTSRGPAIFRQERIGMAGKPFTILKFRTMVDGMYEHVRADPVLWNEYVNHDHKLPAHLARPTRLGSLLRKLSLDELPQLINVLRGEMSMVGVRPIERTQLELRSVESQRLYATLRPGLTGLWQVEGRSALRHEGRIALDDRYVLEWSPMLDVKLLLRTPMAVLRMRHAI